MRKIYYNVSFFCATLVAFMACRESEKSFNLEGSIKNMPEQTIVLEELGFNEVKLIDSTHSDKDGNFHLKGLYIEPALYRIKLGGQFLLVVVDGEHVKVKSQWSDLSNYSAEGSPGTQSLNIFRKEYVNVSREMIALEMVADSLQSTNAPDSLLAMVQDELGRKSADFTSYIKRFSDTTKSLPVALFAASKLLNNESELEYIKTFSSGLSKRFADNQLSKEFKDKVKERLASLQPPASSPQVGSMAPDFTLNSMENKRVALSSFKGKYVLIDFWASWCPPCRAENPYVVAAYKKYKNKNFTILGVSLDEEKTKWEEAIAKDALTWTHVSDLKGWQSEVAEQYGLRSIPANFLLDPSGKIIATDLRGEALDKMLRQILETSQPEQQPGKPKG